MKELMHLKMRQLKIHGLTSFRTNDAFAKVVEDSEAAIRAYKDFLPMLVKLYYMHKKL